MALSSKALQHKREKKKKKRPTKSSKSSNTSATIIAYNNWPIYECWMPVGLWECGLGQVIITRKNNQGDIAIGMYLIDTFCLGVKDCFTRLTTLYEYHNILEHARESCGEINLIDPIYANTLINKSVEYANQFGFKPHNAFSKAKQFLKNIQIDHDLSFTFGRDGKPLYIQ